MRLRRNARKGFTLAEILVALAIFALGGTAIMALFITNVRLSRQAMDYTRAAEITRNVRSFVTESLSRPITLSDTDTVYAFYYPDTALNFDPTKYRETYETNSGATSTGRRADEDLKTEYNAVEQTVFFRLPKQMFDAGSINYVDKNDRMTIVPRDALNADGSTATLNDGGNPIVFGFLPNTLRRVGAIDGLDPDDRMFYQFDFTIRRSVQRASVDNAQGGGGKQPLEDLFVVHVRVFKSFDYTVWNDPYFEWDFYVNASR